MDCARSAVILLVPRLSNSLHKLLAAALAVVSSAVVAQTDATAINKELLRQQERERVLLEKLSATPDVRLNVNTIQAESGVLPAGEFPCFVINAIELTGDSAEKFQWSLTAASKTRAGVQDDPIGKCLGAGAINIVMTRIQNAIAGRGFITTRVLAQPQDLKTGILALRLLPGKVNQIRYPPYSPIKKWHIRPVREQQILNLRDMEQALENLRRVPTVDADMQIAPATSGKPGESDVQINWSKKSPYRLSATLDDAGSDSTGKYQGSLSLSLDHWWAVNDLFYITANNDLGGGDAGERGARGYNVYYSIPVSYWLFAVNSSKNRYHQSVAGAFEDYVYKGESQNSDAHIARLIYRDAVRKTTLNSHLWMRESKNFINDTEVEVQRRQMAGWDFGIAHRELLGTNTLEANLDYRRGTGAMGSIAAPEEAFDEGTARPEIVTSSMQFSIPFELSGQAFRFSTYWRAQWNLTPLIPQDRFSIGGRYSVRGFDGETTLLAERGVLVRNDIGWRILQNSQEIYAALDYGQIAGASSKTLVGTSLSGAGIGFRGRFSGLSYDLFTGQPVSKPTRFRTSSHVFGFTATWVF